MNTFHLIVLRAGGGRVDRDGEKDSSEKRMCACVCRVTLDRLQKLRPSSVSKTTRSRTTTARARGSRTHRRRMNNKTKQRERQQAPESPASLPTPNTHTRTRTNTLKNPHRELGRASRKREDDARDRSTAVCVCRAYRLPWFLFTP